MFHQKSIAGSREQETLFVKATRNTWGGVARIVHCSLEASTYLQLAGIDAVELRTYGLPQNVSIRFQSSASHFFCFKRSPIASGLALLIRHFWCHPVAE